MRKFVLTCVVVFLAASAAIAQAQDTVASPPSVPVPVVTRSQAYCTGFIASPAITRDLFVVGGADDDFHSPSRQFVQGESIFISRTRQDVAVGAEFSIVRPATELFRTMRYSGERWAVRDLGQPYEDVAQVKVTHSNKEGIVAKVTFSCGPIMPGDTLVPFQDRMIPNYVVSGPLDHFAPLEDDKRDGRIAATKNNYGTVGKGDIIYIDLGEKDGTVAGERVRIYKVLPPHPTGFMSAESTPPEIVGEAVVLSVQGRSSVAIIVASYREISSGDYVEKE